MTLVEALERVAQWPHAQIEDAASSPVDSLLRSVCQWHLGRDPIDGCFVSEEKLKALYQAAGVTQKPDKLRVTTKQVIQYLRSRPHRTAREASRDLGISTRAFHMTLSRLRKAGAVQVVSGSDEDLRNAHTYAIADPVLQRAG